MFEQQLIYSISIENRMKDRQKVEKSVKWNKFDDRKKYCLEFNRGSCEKTESHEGILQGQVVFKLHVCKHCLVQDRVELKHAEISCTKGSK